MNYIVIRHSPDWRRFDLNESRAFCLKNRLPETTILDFAAAWDKSLSVRYVEFRQRLKEIATKNLQAVKHATVLQQDEFDPSILSDASLVAFVDDDDLYHPDLFEILSQEPKAEGYIWGSLYLGAIVSGRIRADELILYRPIEPFVYTNNYVVCGAVLKQHPLANFFEHGAAHASLTSGSFHTVLIERYLSCTNKTPASTLLANKLNLSEAFQNDPRRELTRIFERQLKLKLKDTDPPWLQAVIVEYQRLILETIA